MEKSTRIKKIIKLLNEASKLAQYLDENLTDALDSIVEDLKVELEE